MLNSREGMNILFKYPNIYDINFDTRKFSYCQTQNITETVSEIGIYIFILKFYNSLKTNNKGILKATVKMSLFSTINNSEVNLNTSDLSSNAVLLI